MYDKKPITGVDRRQLIFGVVPACSLVCLGTGGIVAGAPEDEEKHKFDQDIEHQLTLMQYFQIRYGEYIKLAKALEKKMGKEKLLEFLKENTREEMLNYGRTQAKGSPDNSFAAYVDTFRSAAYDKSLTKEVKEDTETVFELKVTECIWAAVFRKAGAGDIGYAAVCYGDYAWAEGFNPKIKMIRDKTLMQGHDCCNHRYVWTG